MKYSEFKESIRNLGKDYDVNRKDNQNPDYIYVVYKENDISNVSKCTPFSVEMCHFNSCPKKQEVWNLVTKLAATPIDEREEEKKYNVIIGNDDTNFPYLVWTKDNFIKAYLLSGAKVKGLREGSDFQFTESEYQDLLKYIKTLPQGDKQVEIAKIGKTLVEGK